jgi:hypothetical protein
LFLFHYTDFGEISQLLPEQAASYINHASKVSIPSTKSPKLSASFPLPGHESYPENNSSIKMYVILNQMPSLLSFT